MHLSDEPYTVGSARQISPSPRLWFLFASDAGRRDAVPYARNVPFIAAAVPLPRWGAETALFFFVFIFSSARIFFLQMIEKMNRTCYNISVLLKSGVFRMKKTTAIIWWTAMTLILALTVACFTFHIKVFAFSLKTPYVDRVDRVKGYYVAVYEQTVSGGVNEDGRPYLRMGSDPDGEWKHDEMEDIVVYKRFLFFSKQTEPETYYLVSEDGSVGWGVVYALRASGGTIHYYYTRNYVKWAVLTSEGLIAKVTEGLFSETISLVYDGDEIALSDRCRFSTDVDFTTGDKTVFVNGEPCRFSSTRPD